MRRQIIYTIPYHNRWSLFFRRVLFRIWIGLFVVLFGLIGLVRLLHFLSTVTWSF
jgi:hypothetical protein